MAVLFLTGAKLLAAGSNFTGAKLEQSCLSYVYRIVGKDAEVSLAQKLKDQVFAEGGVEAHCEADGASLRGLCYVSLIFTQDGQLLRKIDIPLRVRIYRQVAVSRDGFQRGKVVGSEDIYFKKVEVTQFREDELPATDQIIGSALNRSIVKGGVFTRTMLDKGKLVHRGDKVAIVVQSGAVVVRTTGFALTDGSIGESIRVKHQGGLLQGQIAMDGSIFVESK